MEAPPWAEGNELPEIFRLAKLRELAEEVNQLLQTHVPVPDPEEDEDDELPINHPITRIMDRDADYPCLQRDPRARRGILLLLVDCNTMTISR
jgi:hypothetical protein